MIRFIGDLHGNLDVYNRLTKDVEFSVQLGDFGFSEWNNVGYLGLDLEKHKIIPGNHDNYDICQNSPHCLMDFGSTKLNDREIFFVRGGISIDRTYRHGEYLSGGKKTYWTQEELNFGEMLDCLKEWSTTCPDILAAHVPPSFLLDKLHTKGHGVMRRFGFHDGFQENTSILISKMIEIQKPKICFFGHHHIHYVDEIDGVLYIGLGINDYFDLE